MKTSMPLEKAFWKRTQQAFSNLRGRVKEKRDKRGRIIRVGSHLEFTLPEFREWVRQHLGGDEQGCGRCEYCGRPIDAMNFSPDHRTPLACGGQSTLENLAFACADCNQVKGKMLADEFKAFRTWCIEHLSPVGWTDVMKRLKMGQGFARMKYFPRQNKTQKAAAHTKPDNTQLSLDGPF